MEINRGNFRELDKTQSNAIKDAHPIEYWETPLCSYCGSDFRYHKQIFYDVKETGHSLVECQKCKLRFYSPRIKFSSLIEMGYGSYAAAQTEANHCYEHGSFYDVADKDREQQKSIVRNYYKASMINKFPKIPTSVFEVGGGVGWFSSIFKQDYNIEITDGCEVNKWSVKVANEKFGLNYSAGEFNNYVPTRKYDCGVMLDYIEHTYTPFQDLKKLANMVEKDGIILIKTFLENLDIQRTMEAPIGHSHHFFGDVLKQMVIDVGFDIYLWQEEGVQVTIIGRKK